MHFKNIEINDFRGFDHLKIEDFGQINLFVGKNNSGKTSVLESLFLLAGCSNAELGYRVNSFREEGIVDNNSEQVLKAFFHNLNENQSAVINSIISDEETIDEQKEEKQIRKLTITPHFKSNFDKRELLSNNSDKRFIDGLIFLAEIANGESFKSQFVLGDSNSENISEGKFIFPCTFIHSRINENYSKDSIEELFKKKKEQKVIEFLNKIDSRILNFLFIGNKLYFDLEGIDERMPISVVGDGVRKLLITLSSIFGGHAGNVILIDEIENGLHYTAHKIMWEGIIEACKLTNAQIFVTTHSLESLKYLNEVLQESEYADFQEKVRCYDLVKTKQKGFQAYKYNYEGFSHALEMETEIR